METRHAPTPDHWPQYAVSWRHMGPPLRPHPQDVRIFEDIAARQAANTPAPRVLLLGVTPELALMKWPARTTLLAMDRCAGMVARVWPGKQCPDFFVLRGDWRHLPLAADSFDFIVGDGCLTVADYPAGYRQTRHALHSVLRPGGALALRFFVQPDRSEGPEAVLADLLAGKIGSFHACKWRLAMALQGSSARKGVRLADIWAHWHRWQQAGFTPPAATDKHWSVEAVRTIDNYLGVAARYSFPTLTDIREVFSERFREEGIFFGSYELAERCPILTFIPKERG